MTFAEKSFEVRFCAALSAAAMPFNRNPQWFGMTQAQERISGIDTMLQIGGELLIFQFKAKHDEKFNLSKQQWDALAIIGAIYPQSTYYVFPEASDKKNAASLNCILKHSWCCSVAKLKKAFKSKAKSARLSLLSDRSTLIKLRPKTLISIRQACSVFVCFCSCFRQSKWLLFGREERFHFVQSGQIHRDARLDRPLSPFAEQFLGIPIGDVPSETRDGRPVKPVTSVDDFERLIGDRATSNLDRGLFGLFLASPLSSEAKFI